MPTENRSSNTEKYSPCPFCSGRVDPEGWLRGDGMRGPECESCGATAPSLAVWNGSQPAQQPHPEPIAWMVGTAIWWTKEEAERDAEASGLPVVPVGPMVDTAEVERLRAALKFYADRDHFADDIGSDWDTVSGEPANVLWHESEAWFVEDGSIARAALERKPEAKAL